MVFLLFLSAFHLFIFSPGPYRICCICLNDKMAVMSGCMGKDIFHGLRAYLFKRLFPRFHSPQGPYSAFTAFAGMIFGNIRVHACRCKIYVLHFPLPAVPIVFLFDLPFDCAARPRDVQANNTASNSLTVFIINNFGGDRIDTKIPCSDLPVIALVI